MSIPLQRMENMNTLRALEITTTARCNLRCKHCYQRNAKPVDNTLSAALLRGVLADAASFGAKTALLTGGEFFLHPEWSEILKIALSFGMRSQVTTNGTLLTPAICEILPSLGVTVVAVSIDGFRQDHDWRRGEGVFDKAISAVRVLHGVGLEVRATVTIDKRNLDYLDELETYLRHIGVKEVMCLNIAAIGAAAENLTDLMPSPEDWDKIRKLYKVNAIPRDNACPIFTSMLSLDSEGTFYPCNMAKTLKMFPLGNVYGDSLKDIWSRTCMESCPARNYRLTDLHQCVSCEAFRLCGGCCRVRAAKYYGDLLAPDPFACFVYRDNIQGDISDLMCGVHPRVELAKP